MLIDDSILKNEYGCGQIKNVDFPKITIETEEGQILELKITKKQKRDPIIWKSIKDIWQAGIWIPFNKKLSNLIESDWLVEPNPAFA